MDLNAREIGVLVPLALGCVVLGVYPTPVIEAIEPVNEAVMALYPAADPGAGAGALAEVTP